jgi:hypothetical protein
MGFGFTVALGFFGEYSLSTVAVAAFAMGFYMPLVVVSIATWQAVRGRDLEDMVTMFGKNTSDIISSFSDIYNHHKWVVFGTTVLTFFGCGGLLGLWFKTQFPGVWSFSPGMLIILTAGAAFCGALAGPGLAIVALFLLKSDNSESGVTGA